MRRWLSLLTSWVLALGGLIFMPIASAGAAATAGGTTLSMMFAEADGTTPMAGATVNVYYNSADAGTATRSLPLIGSGTTTSTGAFSTTLDTTPVAGHLGDIGDGKVNAFNAVAVATDAAGHVALRYEVLTLGGTKTDTATALPGANRSAAGIAAAGSPTLQTTVVATKYAYVPVLADNSSAGMQSALSYTVSSSVRSGRWL